MRALPPYRGFIPANPKKASYSLINIGWNRPINPECLEENS
jgi:hypothetical protein